jgi:hypothetical protein
LNFVKERSIGEDRQTFDNGDQASSCWDHLIADGSLEREYRSKGINGVIALTSLKKTSAYALVARAGLNRSFYKEDRTKQVKKLAQEVLTARLEHLKEKYGWVPGQEFCQLKGNVYTYDNTFRLGGTFITGGRTHFIAHLPAQSVRDFMVEKGLKFFIVNHKVEPVKNFVGHKHAIAMLPLESCGQT